MVAKYTVQMDITAELKAYWHSVYYQQTMLLSCTVVLYYETSTLKHTMLDVFLIFLYTILVYGQMLLVKIK